MFYYYWKILQYYFQISEIFNIINLKTLGRHADQTHENCNEKNLRKYNWDITRLGNNFNVLETRNKIQDGPEKIGYSEKEYI